MIPEAAGAIHSLGTPKPSIPVRGYVVAEDDQQIWLRDQEDTWLIFKRDIADETEWDGARDPRFSGRPTLIFVSEGADIYKLSQFKVQFLTQPITLTGLAHGAPLQVKGDTIVPADEGMAMTEIGFRPGTGIVPTMSTGSVISSMRSQGHVSVCCWDSNWGTTCQADDSK